MQEKPGVGGALSTICPTIVVIFPGNLLTAVPYNYCGHSVSIQNGSPKVNYSPALESKTALFT